jgi:hypothetical protein
MAKAATVEHHTRGAHAKALAINLDPSTYGSLAEIGAGQEVARWLFTVGGASGTVARTISAYDKVVSDATYGPGTRYVSRERLLAMLDHEYSVLVNELAGVRGATTKFFVFAETAAARDYKGDNEQHGWIGIRFQTEPGGPPNDVLLHVNLRDPSADLQQEALGILGINLIYAVHRQTATADEFLAGLFDGLSRRRLELDVVELSGEAWSHADARAWSIHALERDMGYALIFDQSGNLVEPSSVLRKRPLVLDRVRLERVESWESRMLTAATAQLRLEDRQSEHEPRSVVEISIHPLKPDPNQSLGIPDLVAGLDQLESLAPVIISSFPQTYHLVSYLRRQTLEPIRLVMGVSGLGKLFSEQYYQALPGTLLEGVGRVLASNVRLYVYPMSIDDCRKALAGTRQVTVESTRSDGQVTADDLRLEGPANYLFKYLRESGWIVPMPA